MWLIALTCIKGHPWKWVSFLHILVPEIPVSTYAARRSGEFYTFLGSDGLVSSMD